MNIACRSTQNAKRLKRFLRLPIVIKPLIKNRLNKFLITLKGNSFKISSQIWHLSKVRTGWPYRWVWKFFERYYSLIKSPSVLRWSWILNECNLSWKIVKYCILYEVYMIKTAPHSTLSPQMWSIINNKRLVCTQPKFIKKSVWFVFQEFVFHALPTVIKSHYCS